MEALNLDSVSVMCVCGVHLLRLLVQASVAWLVMPWSTKFVVAGSTLNRECNNDMEANIAYTGRPPQNIWSRGRRLLSFCGWNSRLR